MFAAGCKKLWGPAIAAATLLLLLGSGRAFSPAYAADFTVDSTADAADANPGDGVCDDGAGNCTLRAAIQEANALADADTIALPAGTYTLSIAGTGEDAAATGDLDITGDLTITGAGAATTIVDADGIDRVFQIIGDVTVDISGVTIQNGDAYAGYGYGGGIYNDGTLMLTDSDVSGNGAWYGGGIYNDGLLTLTESTISGNRAAGDGGGIQSRGDLTLTNSTVSDNVVANGGQGGGIWSSGTATLINSTLSGNEARESGLISGLGGGIVNWGTLTLTDSTVSGNTADNGSGGGIISDGTLTLTDSTVSGNAALFGAGIWNTGSAVLTNSTVSSNAAGTGGGINNLAGTLTLTNSTISGNTAGVGDGLSGRGGGINNGTTVVSYSAVSGNTAGGDGAGLFSDAGSTATLTVTNSTISGNAAAWGGGIWSDGTATLKNSIVANSLSGGDCSGTITSAGHNLDSDGSCALAGTGDLSGIDPLLGPLAGNGGPTLTQALLEGSPAIDAGSSDCPPPDTDQRGFLRPVDGDDDGSAICDIGAYEFGAMPGLAGDADCDGALTIVDALLIAQLVVGLIDVLACPALADLNQDEEIGIVDALLIAQKVVGLIP